MISGDKPCVLYDRACIACGECDRCDINPKKICDNCMQCVNDGRDYRAVLIDGIEPTLEKKAVRDARANDQAE